MRCEASGWCCLLGPHGEHAVTSCRSGSSSTRHTAAAASKSSPWLWTQGPALALRYVQAARATYPVLLDAEGVLSSLYGFQAIPNGWLIDAEGVIRFEHIGGFDIRKPQTAEAIERVLKGAAALRAEHESRGPRQEVS